MIRLVILLAALAACSSSPPPPEPVREEPPPPEEPVAGADAGPSIDDLRLAAFTKVMEETAAIRHECWARGAADDYRLSGRVVLSLKLGEGGAPTDVKVEQDSTGDEVLTSCLVERYGRHPWPAVFDPGTRVQAPMAFDAPRAQYTVALAHAPHVSLAEGKLEVHPLLFAKNTGNPAAALTLMSISDGLEVPMHRHPESAELLYIAGGQGTLYDLAGKKRGVEVEAGDAIYLPAGKEHAFVQTGDEPVQAIQLYAPAGAEQRFFPDGDASGTVPLKPGELKKKKRKHGLEVAKGAGVRPIEIADGQGWTKIYFDAESAGDDAAHIGIIALNAGAKVPAHVHESSSEYLYLYKGRGTLTVAGRDFPIEAPVAAQMPAGVEHAFTAESDVEALQFYTPSGPEQRFK